MYYTHEIRAWKDGSDAARTRMACNSEPEARALLAHVLRAGSEYDHALLCVRRGTTDYFTWEETGHREGTVAHGLRAGTINRAMIPVVDQAYADMMAANATEPYVHAEYDRCDRVLCAALVMLTNGDQPYADALRWAFTDSGEDADYYLTCEGRNAFCFNAGTMSREDYEATLRFAVHCEEGDSTWVDAFETREQAEQYAADLKAVTTVVDRQAAHTS